MNRVGLKDYLLNYADDIDLLDCAKAWDAANEYGQFDTYSSVEEAAQANGWDAAQVLSEARRVDQDADFFCFNGYGHLESVSKASLLATARDSVDNIIDWLDSASRYELEDISSDIELMVDAKDPFDIINEVDCSNRYHGNNIEVNLSRGQDKATLSFSKLDDIDGDKIDLANAVYATVENYSKYADGCSTEEVQTKFREEHGRGLSAERADQLTAACEKNMDALTQVLDDDEIEALDNLFNVELCSETYCATLANEALGCKYISSALEKMGFDVENGRAIEKHADLEARQRFEFDAEQGDDFGEVSKYLGEFFKGCDYVSDMVFERGQDKAFAVIDSFDRDADGSCWIDPRMSMLAGLFSWSPTIDAGSISGLVDSASYYQKHLMSDREGFELSNGRPLPDMSARPLGAGARELLDKLTSSETVSYFPEFNLLVTTTDFVPSGLHNHESAIFNVFPSELAYGKLFQGFENVADIPYSGPVVDPIALLSTFGEDAAEKHAADGSLRSLATLLSGADVINTKSIPELLDTMSDRFGLEPEERARIAVRAQAKEQARTQGPDIGVEIDSQNDDGFITGTVTVDGESCYFSSPNNSRDSGNHDAVILEPLRPDGFGGDFGVAELPTVIDENRDIVELVVSVAAAPYMDSDKLLGCEQSLDSLCDEKTDEAQSMRYGMEGVGLPMLDAAEHLVNY